MNDFVYLMLVIGFIFITACIVTALIEKNYPE